MDSWKVWTFMCNIPKLNVHSKKKKKKNQQNLMKQSKTDKILSELETFQVFSVFGHSRSNFSMQNNWYL